jgi:hypothetical protein
MGAVYNSIGICRYMYEWLVVLFSFIFSSLMRSELETVMLSLVNGKSKGYQNHWQQKSQFVSSLQMFMQTHIYMLCIIYVIIVQVYWPLYSPDPLERLSNWRVVLKVTNRCISLCIKQKSINWGMGALQCRGWHGSPCCTWWPVCGLQPLVSRWGGGGVLE